MNSESAACQQDAKQDGGSEPVIATVIGTLVEVSQSNKLLVELDGPDGEDRRCSVLATVPIEVGMVGQPVELTFLGASDRPVITRVIDVEAELRARWEALGGKALGLEPGPWKLSAMVEELRMLACMAAWLHAQGSITHGAARVGTSRRAFRENVRRWTCHNPRLVDLRKLGHAVVERNRPKAKARPLTTAPAPLAVQNQQEAK